MGQVTIYLEKDVEQKMRMAAKTENLSQSKWIANIIKEKVVDQWPDSVKALAGAWSDFPSIEELRSNQVVDAPREDW
ncbi:MAG: hypothetical protein MJK04_18325 [Psychrosphaera sp.]|nr:hypothetical protein [Psychrosphaera sp.]